MPIEVRSGKDYTIHSAMNNCLANSEYQMQEGIVFANCNVSRKGKVTYLPIYMVMFLQKDSEQIVLDKIEFSQIPVLPKPPRSEPSSVPSSKVSVGWISMMRNCAMRLHFSITTSRVAYTGIFHQPFAPQ